MSSSLPSNIMGCFLCENIYTKLNKACYSNCCDLFLCQISKIKALLAPKIPLMGFEMHKFIPAAAERSPHRAGLKSEKSAKVAN